MKKIIASILVTVSLSVKSQVIIGDNAGSVPANSNAILSFSSENMGIVLPIINSATETASSNNVVRVPGTLYVSRADKQIKVYMLPTTQNSTGLLPLTPTLPAAVTLPTANTVAESTQNAGVIIGVQTTSQKGILVLENDKKTLVMPSIGTRTNPPHKAIKSPYIGTIGFAETDNVVFPTTKPSKKLLWVFNGGNKSINGAGQWHLWRAGAELPPTGVIDQNYLDSLP
jgi:hypothetical protein